MRPASFAATAAAYFAPGPSASGHSVTSRSASGAQSARPAPFDPTGEVVTTIPHAASASAAFSPSTTITGASRSAAKSGSRYSGRGTGIAFGSHPPGVRRVCRNVLPFPGGSNRSTSPTGSPLASR